jgi:hypothetical protein
MHSCSLGINMPLRSPIPNILHMFPSLRSETKFHTHTHSIELTLGLQRVCIWKCNVLAAMYTSLYVVVGVEEVFVRKRTKSFKCWRKVDLYYTLYRSENTKSVDTVHK